MTRKPIHEKIETILDVTLIENIDLFQWHPRWTKERNYANMMDKPNGRKEDAAEANTTFLFKDQD